MKFRIIIWLITAFFSFINVFWNTVEEDLLKQRTQEYSDTLERIEYFKNTPNVNGWSDSVRKSAISILENKLKSPEYDSVDKENLSISSKEEILNDSFNKTVIDVVNDENFQKSQDEWTTSEWDWKEQILEEWQSNTQLTNSKETTWEDPESPEITGQEDDNKEWWEDSKWTEPETTWEDPESAETAQEENNPEEWWNETTSSNESWTNPEPTSLNTNQAQTNSYEWDDELRKVWNKTIMESLFSITDKNSIVENDSKNGLWVLANIFIWIKNTLTALISVVAVWVFLYIWAKLSLARWNPEEFSKAMSHLTYAIIWIAIASIAWAAVKLISWLNI